LGKKTGGEHERANAAGNVKGRTSDKDPTKGPDHQDPNIREKNAPKNAVGRGRIDA